MSQIREKKAHQDCYALADPDQLARGKKFLRKASKTAWSALDHKKAKVGIYTGTVAANVAIAIATGGLSIPAQIGIAVAASVAAGGADKAIDHAVYKHNKAQLKKFSQAGPAAQLKKEQTRAAGENFEHNEGYMKAALSRTIHKCRRLKTHTEVLKKMTAAQLQGDEAKVLTMLTDIYAFYMEYDQLLHYFNQYAEFLDFSRRFGTALRDKAAAMKITTDAAAKTVVLKDNAWHAANCRKSRILTDTCYGPKAGAPDDPHQPVS